MDATCEQDGPSAHPWGALFLMLKEIWRYVTLLPECLVVEGELPKQPQISLNKGMKTTDGTVFRLVVLFLT